MHNTSKQKKYLTILAYVKARAFLPIKINKFYIFFPDEYYKYLEIVRIILIFNNSFC